MSDREWGVDSFWGVHAHESYEAAAEIVALMHSKGFVEAKTVWREVSPWREGEPNE